MVPFQLPPGFQLVLGEVDAGSNTPRMVSRLLEWKSENQEAGGSHGRYQSTLSSSSSLSSLSPLTPPPSLPPPSPLPTLPSPPPMAASEFWTSLRTDNDNVVQGLLELSRLAAADAAAAEQGRDSYRAVLDRYALLSGDVCWLLLLCRARVSWVCKREWRCHHTHSAAIPNHFHI